MDRKRINIIIDPVVWKEFQNIAKKMNLSASRLAEILMRAQVMSRKETVEAVMTGLFKDMMEADKSLTIEEKLKMEKLFKDE